MWNQGSDSTRHLTQQHLLLHGSDSNPVGIARSHSDLVHLVKSEDDKMAVVHDTSATVAQCVLITITGYVSSKLHLLNEEQLQGVEKFTSSLALPALMFTNMASIDLQKAHANMIFGIFMAKVAILLSVVCAGYYLSNRKKRPWNVIGLYGIFSTMCNDFGIALPISSVKGDRSVNGPSQASLLARTVLRTLAYSHVVVCLLGGIFNVTGWQKCLPSFVESSLKITGDSFASLILFLLGFRLDHQKNSKSQSTHKLSVITLSITKTIVLPILCLIGVRILSGSVALSNFAFIYGAVPTPPLVTVYATEYSINPQEISMAVCVSSVLSLPLLFVASKATALAIAQPDTSDYAALSSSLVPGVLCLCIANFLCGLLIVVYLTKISSRYTLLPFHFILCFSLTQILQSVGLVFWHLPELVLEVYPVFFVTCGQMSGRLFLAFFAMSISPSLTESSQLERFKRPLTFIGFSLPALVTLSMHIWVGPNEDIPGQGNPPTALPLFLHGHMEMVLFACILSFSLCASFGSLLDIFFRDTGLSSPIVVVKENVQSTAIAENPPATTTRSKPTRHRSKHMLALVCLTGSAFVGLIHTYWRISDPNRKDRPLLMAVEFLDGYMTFSQAVIIMIVYGIHSKYYGRAERIIYTSRLFRKLCNFVSSSFVVASFTAHGLRSQHSQPVLINAEFDIDAKRPPAPARAIRPVIMSTMRF
ncbi:integral membrane protein GPR155-like isoform X4 [Varroa jacobsoni]|uniref:integral membrane protein GPR155-like isoform X4 n=1 Tax=Varroa jacobsoni TaxID=62625 RepID=UPI000BF530F0|nr:integral membrane protein GPR155-like isoform X4 [Varroa jacobsoni]